MKINNLIKATPILSTLILIGFLNIGNQKVNTKLTKGGRRDSTAGFPSLHSASSIRVTKEEKRLGKKASEKFIDVKDNNNNKIFYLDYRIYII